MTSARSLTGPDGAFAGMEKGAIFVDHTTASAEVARELHVALRRRPDLGSSMRQSPAAKRAP